MSDAADHAEEPADRFEPSIDTHPDLIDPEWNASAEREARKAARKAGRHVLDQPQPRQQRPRGARWRFALSSRSISAALGLLIAVLLFALVNQISDDQTEGANPAPAGAVPISGTAPRTTPNAQEHGRLNLNQPFADTPAAGWSDGAAGFQLPAPVKTDGWSATTVGKAEAQVKQTLIDAHLDPAVLLDHNLTTYLGSLAPNARAAQQSRINSLLGKQSIGDVSLLAAGFQLLPAPIKVDGSMSVTTDASGELLIHTNYVFAFAFAPGSARDVSQPWQIVAVQHVAQDFMVPAGARYKAGDRGVWPGTTQSYADQIACTEINKGFLAPAYSDNANVDPPQDTDDPNALYAPSHALTITDSCPAPPQHA
ncbi:MAG TPA: hypothetical protein VHX38_19735 [Pseudonocardiaceae bacterium]|nr:hypothetical protein [Pseudonocardiaceae bacterium]